MKTVLSHGLFLALGAMLLAADCDPPPEPTTMTVSVERSGAGTGRVVGVEGIHVDLLASFDFGNHLIDCPARCVTYSANANSSVRVFLAATADPGSRFAGWSGDCEAQSEPRIARVIRTDAYDTFASCTARFELDVQPDAGADAAIDATIDASVDVTVADLLAPIDRGVEDLDAPGPSCGPRTSAGACTPGAAGCDLVDLSVGDDNFSPTVCAVFSDGSVRCWSAGCSAAGVVAGLDRVRAIGRGQQFICAARDGQAMPVWCWGANNGAQFAQRAPLLAMTPTATAIPAGTLSLGGASGISLSAPGVYTAWGRNQYGQLGDGTFEPTDGPQGVDPREVRVSGLRQVTLERLNGAVACGAFDDGSARCWGQSTGGHFGAAAPSGGRSASPVVVPGVVDVRAVAVAPRFACAVRNDAQLWCWGSGNDPRMAGAGTTPSRVLDRVTQVALGGLVACARRDDGTVWCWGAGSLVGNGGGGFVAAPEAVAGLSGVRAVYAGTSTVCAWRGGADLRCWGAEVTGAADGAATPTAVVW